MTCIPGFKDKHLNIVLLDQEDWALHCLPTALWLQSPVLILAWVSILSSGTGLSDFSRSHFQSLCTHSYGELPYHLI